jgi:hypothetical protein
MLRRNLFGTTVLSATVLLAQGASADVTVDDVMGAYRAQLESLGAQVFETAETDGTDTVVTGNALLFRLPLEIGTVRVEKPDYRMTPQSDGTVAMSFADTHEYRIEVDIPAYGSGSMVLEVTHEGYEAVASGSAGDVTITQSADAYAFEVSALEGTDEFFDLSMAGQGTDFDLATHIVVGDMVTSTATSSTGPAELAYVVTDVDGGIVSETAQIGANESTVEMALPAGGSDILNLSPAFAAGAYLKGTVVDAGGTRETITTLNGDVVSEESQSTSETTSRFSINKDGFEMFGETGPAEFRAMMPDLMPFPIEGSFAGGTGAFAMPLMASEDEQDVAVRMDIRELTLSEDLWGLFDPANDLPRDPVSLNVDVAGTVVSGIDFLNFAALEAQMGQGVPPISAESVTINEISVEAIGASALATGSFTLDNTDVATFDGLPRPEGSAILNVTGANGLIDRLVSLGVIGQEEAGMARLGMGFIARATGDDAFETRLDVNAEGHVIVNGQRMR